MKRLFIALLFASLSISQTPMLAMNDKIEDKQIKTKEETENIIDITGRENSKKEAGNSSQESLVITLFDRDGKKSSFTLPKEIIQKIISYFLGNSDATTFEKINSNATNALVCTNKKIQNFVFNMSLFYKVDNADFVNYLLCAAAKNNNFALFIMIVNTPELRIKITDSTIKNAFFFFCQNGSEIGVKFFINTTKFLELLTPENIQDAFFWVCCNGNEKLVQLFTNTSELFQQLTTENINHCLLNSYFFKHDKVVQLFLNKNTLAQRVTATALNEVLTTTNSSQIKKLILDNLNKYHKPKSCTVQ